MEDLDVVGLDGIDGLAGRQVLVTGHSGFKGTWLTTWLTELGSEVVGLSLPFEIDPTNIIGSTGIAGEIEHIPCDVRDGEAVLRAVQSHQPEIIFHLAAQSLVRASHEDPVGTFATNVMGGLHVLEAARSTQSVRAVVMIATDKVYRNLEDGRPYRETDPLGGEDPYSASKAAAELVTHAYRASFAESQPLIASVRAGNVLGAGDDSQDRIVPDIVRAIVNGDRIRLRNPNATRPWQHVLEPLAAYLLVGARLLNGEEAAAQSWNVGPAQDAATTVDALARAVVDTWGATVSIEHIAAEGPVEAQLLNLDTSKAAEGLGFSPRWDFDETVRYVVAGYRSLLAGADLAGVIRDQVAAYSAGE